MSPARALVLWLAASIACSSGEGGEERRPADAAGASAAAAGGLEGGTASPVARQAFTRGMAALHAFWYEQAISEFEAALAADPAFVMAAWGLAMSHSKLLWGEDDLAAGRAALRRLPPSSSLPPRERLWVRAAIALFSRGDPLARRRLFITAMEEIQRQFPDDDSQAFLALALLSTMPPQDAAARPARMRAGELAEEVFRRNPRHPGAAHYLIHAYDTPQLASRALAAARAYAVSAPEAFHARHMPAHIFSRLGMWKDAITSCRAAWDASVVWTARVHLPAEHLDWHSLGWIIEMSFERGRRADAEVAMRTFADAVEKGLDHKVRSAYARQVGSYLARTGEWKRVDELLAPLDAPATVEGRPEGQGTPAPAGGGAFCADHAPAGGPPLGLIERRAALGARVRAAAMRRDLAATRRLLGEQKALDAELRPFFAAAMGEAAVAAEEAANAQSDAAMLARARRDDRALVAALGPIAERAKGEFAAEGTAGGILAREEIGDALLRLGRADEARAAYEVVLAEHPGRASALLGAARASSKAGQAEAARERYRQLVEVWGEAEETTPGLAEARRGAGPAAK